MFTKYNIFPKIKAEHNVEPEDDISRSYRDLSSFWEIYIDSNKR